MFWLKQWKLGIVFLLGTAMAAGLLEYWDLHPHSDPGWLAQAPVIPGFVLSSTVFIFIGGVHGSHPEVWFWSIAPLNGIAYALIWLWLGGIKKLFIRLRKTTGHHQ